MNRVRRGLPAALTVVLLTGCGWLQSGFDAGRSHSNDGETRINAANVAAIVDHTFPTSGTASQILVVGARLLVMTNTTVFAYDATSCPNSTNTACPVVWQFARRDGEVASDGTRIFIPTPAGVAAVDLDGHTLWTSSLPTAFQVGSTRLVVSDGFLYVGFTIVLGQQQMFSQVARVATTGCGQPTCPVDFAPVDGSSIGYSPFAVFAGTAHAAVSIRDGVLLTTSNFDAPAYDLKDPACTSIPITCAPLKEYRAIGFEIAAASSRHVIGLYQNCGCITATLGWYRAARQTCGGTPQVCSRQARATVIDPQSFAVGGDVLYTATATALQAFDEAATANCSGAPKVCTPLLNHPLGSAPTSAVIVTNGHVYLGTADGFVHVFTLPGTIS